VIINVQFDEHPVEEVPDTLIDGYDARDVAKDDLALVSLRPVRIAYRDQRVIIGGTTSPVEQRFQKGRTSGHYKDLYAPMLKAGAA